MEGSKIKGLRFANVSLMLAIPNEVGMPYFTPFLETQNSDHVAHVSLNRGMPSTSQIDGLTRMVEKIKKNQEKMEKSMKELKMNTRKQGRLKSTLTGWNRTKKKMTLKI
uniref:Uncharacterized protein n=1 Tax=Cucumis melo TaxID=3656 RepID=A0A9I9EES6_CUCME